MGVNIEKVFGENVFDDAVMKVRLPKSDTKQLRNLCTKAVKSQKI